MKTEALQAKEAH